MNFQLDRPYVEWANYSELESQLGGSLKSVGKTTGHGGSYPD